MKRLMGFALICMAAACGGGGGEDRTDDFVATWNADAGATAKIDCDDDQFDSMDPLTGGLTLIAGTDADLTVNETPEAGCTNPKFNVSGSKASLVSGTGGCMSTEDGVTQMNSYSKFDLTLDSAGSKLTIDAAGSLSVSGSITVTCTVSLTGTATKGAGGGSARTADYPLLALPQLHGIAQ